MCPVPMMSCLEEWVFASSQSLELHRITVASQLTPSLHSPPPSRCFTDFWAIRRNFFRRCEPPPISIVSHPCKGLSISKLLRAGFDVNPKGSCRPRRTSLNASTAVHIDNGFSLAQAPKGNIHSCLCPG
ncbi:hypothetical protein CH063_12489 [Colletotrichum higginsianum]|uniref:Uncharacterized protein n=1 Tax=Colletotrichum higginsianum (strain IMI 349063) TaxID=759273 RepID=H1VQK7_COLHI|nr:hypothetical protein CH63R_12208 [Colletotrichum higginsianum IMI 349063]OBR05505.1 hypothetical protein CH63R_12208 [Colletotrichum higginsianum IMI 349063]CCF42513.1 hypothetical protein CH063_12489 [Colletotrichum higginsianum]